MAPPALGLFSFLAAGLIGCNNYEIFLVSGYEQASYSNDADVIFIIDNSSSMEDEAEALALNFRNFISYLTDLEEGAGRTTEDISDAVDNYITYVSDRGRLLDYQLAITTTTIATGSPGGGGSLVGNPDILQKNDPEVETAFTKALLCQATCWNPAAVPSDLDFECTDDPDTPEVISLEYLDCVCGSDVWESSDHCGAGDEEGLEAAFLSLCRAGFDSPPEECYDEFSPLTDSDLGSNAGLVRDDSTVIFVVVTDEGDGSRRLENQNPDPSPYLDLLDQFGVRYRFAVIGPNYVCEEDANGNEQCSLVCNSGGATTWGTSRYQTAAAMTGGFFNPLEESSGSECLPTEFDGHLQQLGDLLNALVTAFPLQSVPDTSTIQCYVNGNSVPEDAGTEEADGTYSYTDGWSYDPSLNAVVFHGDSIPDYNEDVRIYYRPLEGMPRTLPF